MEGKLAVKQVPHRAFALFGMTSDGLNGDCRTLTPYLGIGFENLTMRIGSWAAKTGVNIQAVRFYAAANFFQRYMGRSNVRR